MTAAAEITVPLPETIVLEYQPYSTETLGELRLGDYNGHPTLEGTVISGSERGFLFGMASNPVDTSGRRRTVYGIRDHELQAGRIVRVAA